MPTGMPCGASSLARASAASRVPAASSTTVHASLPAGQSAISGVVRRCRRRWRAGSWSTSGVGVGGRRSARASAVAALLGHLLGVAGELHQRQHERDQRDQRAAPPTSATGAAPARRRGDRGADVGAALQAPLLLGRELGAAARAAPGLGGGRRRGLDGGHGRCSRGAASGSPELSGGGTSSSRRPLASKLGGRRVGSSLAARAASARRPRPARPRRRVGVGRVCRGLGVGGRSPSAAARPAPRRSRRGASAAVAAVGALAGRGLARALRLGAAAAARRLAGGAVAAGSAAGVSAPRRRGRRRGSSARGRRRGCAARLERRRLVASPSHWLVTDAGGSAAPPRRRRGSRRAGAGRRPRGRWPAAGSTTACEPVVAAAAAASRWARAFASSGAPQREQKCASLACSSPHSRARAADPGLAQQRLGVRLAEPRLERRAPRRRAPRSARALAAASRRCGSCAVPPAVRWTSYDEAAEVAQQQLAHVRAGTQPAPQLAAAGAGRRARRRGRPGRRRPAGRARARGCAA